MEKLLIDKSLVMQKKANNVNIYKSSKKTFIVITKINEKSDKVYINRSILWYDSKKETYRKRTESQLYDSYDVCKENKDTDRHDDEEFKFDDGNLRELCYPIEPKSNVCLMYKKL